MEAENENKLEESTRELEIEQMREILLSPIFKEGVANIKKKKQRRYEFKDKNQNQMFQTEKLNTEVDDGSNKKEMEEMRKLLNYPLTDRGSIEKERVKGGISCRELKGRASLDVYEEFFKEKESKNPFHRWNTMPKNPENKSQFLLTPKKTILNLNSVISEEESPNKLDQKSRKSSPPISPKIGPKRNKKRKCSAKESLKKGKKEEDKKRKNKSGEITPNQSMSEDNDNEENKGFINYPKNFSTKSSKVYSEQNSEIIDSSFAENTQTFQELGTTISTTSGVFLFNPKNPNYSFHPSDPRYGVPKTISSSRPFYVNFNIFTSIKDSSQTFTGRANIGMSMVDREINHDHVFLRIIFF